MIDQLSVGELRKHAHRVLNSVHVENVRLKRLNCDSRMDLASGPFDVSTDISFKGRQVESGGVEAWIKYEVTAAIEEPDAESAWTLDFEIVVEFGLDEDADDRFSVLEVNSFAFALGITHAHPFARELVQNMSGRLGYPPFTLDMFIPPTSGEDNEVIEFALPIDVDNLPDEGSAPNDGQEHG